MSTVVRQVAVRQIKVTFTHVDRSVALRWFEVTTSQPDGLELANEIAEAIWRYLKQHELIESAWFTVMVNWEQRNGLIEEGRFGSFTLEERT